MLKRERKKKKERERAKMFASIDERLSNELYRSRDVTDELWKSV